MWKWNNVQHCKLEFETLEFSQNAKSTFLALKWPSLRQPDNLENLVKNNLLFTNLKKLLLAFLIQIFVCFIPVRNRLKWLGRINGTQPWFLAKKMLCLYLCKTLYTFCEIAGVIILWSFNASKCNSNFLGWKCRFFTHCELCK